MLCQKTIGTGAAQIETDGPMERYFYTNHHEAIISDEMFVEVQQEKFNRFKSPENAIAINLAF